MGLNIFTEKQRSLLEMCVSINHPLYHCLNFEWGAFYLFWKNTNPHDVFCLVFFDIHNWNLDVQKENEKKFALSRVLNDCFCELYHHSLKKFSWVSFWIVTSKSAPAVFFCHQNYWLCSFFVIFCAVTSFAW